jgi:hypothetical protein
VVIGSHVVGDEVQDQAIPRAASACLALASALRPQEMIIDSIAADAVGGSHNVVGVANREERRRLARRSSFDNAMATPAGLRCKFESKIGDFIPLAIGDRPKIDNLSFGPADCFQPGPGVDLVEIGL